MVAVRVRRSTEAMAGMEGLLPTMESVAYCGGCAGQRSSYSCAPRTTEAQTRQTTTLM